MLEYDFCTRHKFGDKNEYQNELKILDITLLGERDEREPLDECQRTTVRYMHLHRRQDI